MIYQVYWDGLWPWPATAIFWTVQSYKVYPYNLQGLEAGDKVTFVPAFAEIVKESKNDSFCLVITKPQNEQFQKLVDEHGLKEYIAYEQSYWSTNSDHHHRDEPNGGCKLVVFQHPEHPQRIAAKDEPEITEENFMKYIGEAIEREEVAA